MLLGPLYALAALQGSVQAGDGVAHAIKMRRRSAEREILQQHHRQPQREERAHDDDAHEAHLAEGLFLKVMRVAEPSKNRPLGRSGLGVNVPRFFTC